MSEYFFNNTELDIPTPVPGDVGEITMTVEVMTVNKDGISLMKHGPVKVSKPFKDMSLDQLRTKIGIVQDEEMPMQKENKDLEEPTKD